MAAFDAHARTEEGRVPLRRVGPDPTRMLALALGDRRGEPRLGHERFGAMIVDEGHAPGAPVDDDVHALSLPPSGDSADRGQCSSEPSAPSTFFSPASTRNGNRFCFGGSGQLKA